MNIFISVIINIMLLPQNICMLIKNLDWKLQVEGHNACVEDADANSCTLIQSEI